VNVHNDYLKTPTTEKGRRIKSFHGIEGVLIGFVSSLLARKLSEILIEMENFDPYRMQPVLINGTGDSIAHRHTAWE
jgi:molecular chaperone GrpE (heat shock protein)